MADASTSRLKPPVRVDHYEPFTEDDLRERERQKKLEKKGKDGTRRRRGGWWRHKRTDRGAARRAAAEQEQKAEAAKLAARLERERRSDRVLRLPRTVVVALPLVLAAGSREATLRYELLTLAIFAAFYKGARDEVNTFRYSDGAEIVVPEREFVVSVERVAQIAWRLVVMRDVPQSGLEDAAFRLFYCSIRKAVQVLMEARIVGRPVLTYLGPARDEDGKRGDHYGQRWTLSGGLVDEHLDLLTHCEAQPAWRAATTLTEVREAYRATAGDREPVADAVESADVLALYRFAAPFLEESWRPFTECAKRVGGEGRKEHPSVALAFQRSRAKQAKREFATHTTGTRPRGEVMAPMRPYRPWQVPYVSVHLAAVTAAATYRCVQGIAGELARLGAPLDELVVLYDGCRGFELRLPHGWLGCPFYLDANTAQWVLYELVSRLVLTHAMTVFSVMRGHTRVAHPGPDAFTPLFHQRVFGSVNEQTDLHCLGLTGAELVRLDIEAVQYRASKQNFVAFSVPDPSNTSMVPALAKLFDEVVETITAERATKPTSE